MEATKHFRKRIQERTFLKEELVLKMLDGGVYTRIGNDYADCQYLLLYSSFDNMYFVVVFDPKNDAAITILYDLGKKFCGSLVTSKHKKAAKRKWQNYVKKLGIEKEQATIEKQKIEVQSRTVQIFVEVQLNGKREFFGQLGELPSNESGISHVLATFHTELEAVAGHISSWSKTKSFGLHINVALYRKKEHQPKMKKMASFRYETFCTNLSEISPSTSQP